MELLAAKSVGRIAYAVDKGARILPVNYILNNDSIIFRTTPGGEIFHHALESICAFEIDDTDEFFESGWSWSQSDAWNWRPKRTSHRCGMESFLSPGLVVTDGCSYGCLASICPAGG
jgi:hypothetical protein